MLFQRQNWILDEALKGPVLWEMFYPQCFCFLSLNCASPVVEFGMQSVCCLHWQAEGRYFCAHPHKIGTGEYLWMFACAHTNKHTDCERAS